MYSITNCYSKTTENVSVMWKQMENVIAVLYQYPINVRML